METVRGKLHFKCTPTASIVLWLFIFYRWINWGSVFTQFTWTPTAGNYHPRCNPKPKFWSLTIPKKIQWAVLLGNFRTQLSPRSDLDVTSRPWSVLGSWNFQFTLENEPVANHYDELPCHKIREQIGKLGQNCGTRTVDTWAEGQRTFIVDRSVWYRTLGLWGK